MTVLHGGKVVDQNKSVSGRNSTWARLERVATHELS